MKIIKAGHLVAENPFDSDDDCEEIEENLIFVDEPDSEETKHSESNNGEQKHLLDSNSY